MSSSQLALITGASSGIGATYAKRLASRGYDLILVARDEKRLNALAQELQHAQGIKARVIAADLTKPADLQRVEHELSSNSEITLFINNAGMSTAGRFLDSDITQVQTMLTLNIAVPTQLAYTAARAFRQRGAGALVNIASVMALINETGNGAYNATKSFLLTLSQAMASELSGSAVHVQAVLPGLTRTEIFERSGRSMADLPAEMIMNVEDLVDAALNGLDRGESVTIPSLEESDLWENFEQQRRALHPYLSLNKPATRYQVK